MKSLNKAFLGIFLVISFLACIASCKPSVPGEYLSEKEMENVLYDFHIAEAMANDNSRQDGDAAMITYREAVFRNMALRLPSLIRRWSIICAIRNCCTTST